MKAPLLFVSASCLIAALVFLWLGELQRESLNADIAKAEQTLASRQSHDEDLVRRREQAAGWSSELARLRAEKEEADAIQAYLEAPLPESPAEQLRRQQQAQLRPPPVLPPGYTACERIENQGRATPLATGNTFLHAIHMGDTQMLAECVGIPPGSRAAVENLHASLSDEQRQELPTPESLLASYLTAMYGRFQGAKVDARVHGTQTWFLTEMHMPTGVKRPFAARLTPDSGSWKVELNPSLINFVLSDNARRAAATQLGAPAQNAPSP